MIAKKNRTNKPVENKQLRGEYFYQFYNNEDCNENHFSAENKKLLYDAAYLLGRGGSYLKKRSEFNELIENYIKSKKTKGKDSPFNDKEREYLIEIANISNRGLEQRAGKIKSDFFGSSKKGVDLQKKVAGSSDSLQKRIYEPTFAGIYAVSDKKERNEYSGRKVEDHGVSSGDAVAKDITSKLTSEPLIPELLFPELNNLTDSTKVGKPDNTFGLKDDEITLKKIRYAQREDELRRAGRKGKLKAGLLGLLAGALIFGIGGCIYSKKQYEAGKKEVKSEFTTTLSDVEYSWSNKLFAAEETLETTKAKLSEDNAALSDQLLSAWENAAQKEKRLTFLRKEYSSLSNNYALTMNELGKLNLENELLSCKVESDGCEIMSLREKVGALSEKEAERASPINAVSEHISRLNGPQPITNISSEAADSVDLSVSAASSKKSLSHDVDKYRAYAVNQGSRDSLQSLQKSGDSLKDAGNSLVGAMTFSYGNSEFKALREDDLSIKKPARGFGKSLVSFFRRLGGPISDKNAYKGLNPLTGTATYLGRLVGGAIGIGKNAANMATLGMGNNIIEPALNGGKNLLESGKHLGQSGLNITRLPTKSLSGNTRNTSDNILDWIGLVPLEYVSNVAEGEGFSNAENMQQAVKDKGNAGVILESVGSGALLGYGIDNALDNPVSNGGGRIDGPGVK